MRDRFTITITIDDTNINTVSEIARDIRREHAGPWSGRPGAFRIEVTKLVNTRFTQHVDWEDER